MGHGPMDPWALGPIGPWTHGPFGPIGPWTHGPLDHWGHMGEPLGTCLVAARSAWLMDENDPGNPGTLGRPSDAKTPSTVTSHKVAESAKFDTLVTGWRKKARALPRPRLYFHCFCYPPAAPQCIPWGPGIFSFLFFPWGGGPGPPP